MAEYIDLDTPLELYVEHGGFYEKRISTLRDLLDTNKIPYKAADVVARDCYDRLLVENDELRKVRPVVRGHIEEDENTYLFCSECNCNITLTAYETPDNRFVLRPNYCPNCGARMEES